MVSSTSPCDIDLTDVRDWHHVKVMTWARTMCESNLQVGLPHFGAGLSLKIVIRPCLLINVKVGCCSLYAGKCDDCERYTVCLHGDGSSNNILNTDEQVSGQGFQ